MISNETVLILGAGASYPFGFPLGAELINQIVEIGKNRHSPACAQLVRISNQFCDSEFNENDVTTFVAYLSRSHLFSIDAFLENKDPIRLKIGKLLIVQALIRCENKDKVLIGNLQLFPHLNEDKARYERRWYGYLFNKMYCPWEKFHENKLAIITFNYDRSLEYFLYHAIRAAYPGKRDEEYISKYISIPIIHVHGRMGGLPWETGFTVDYGNRDDFGNPDHYTQPIFDRGIYDLISQIRIIHEEIDSSEEIRIANDLIEKSKWTHFLGFGYHDLNIKRLRSGISRRKGTYGNISGSAYNLEAAEKDDIMRLVHSIASVGIDLSEKNTDVLGYLRSKVNFVA